MKRATSKRIPGLPLTLLAATVLAAACVPNDYYGDIVFVHTDAPGIWGDLYVMNWDGTGWRQLTDSGADAYPRWSPDKDKIAFNRRIGGAGGQWDLYVINPDGTGEMALITGAANDITPAWSPDGHNLAYQSDRFGDVAIYIAPATGGIETRLDTPAGVTPSHPSWSPDGEEIAFEGVGVGVTNGIYTVDVDVDGDGWDLVVEDGQEPDWYRKSSLNRGLITYCYGSDIRVINADGTDMRIVARGENPKWSVDFKTIVYQYYLATEGDDYDLYKAEIDGRTTRLSNNVGQNELYPHW